MNQKKADTKMALDYLPFGDDESMEQMKGKITKALPEGVSNRMVYKDVIHIAWPSFIELMLTQLVSMVDLMMVGSLGTWALSAVGLTNQPKFLMMTMIIAMNVGATALVARAKGAGDKERANLIVRQSLLLTLIFSVAASIIGYIFAEPMIKFMGAADAESLNGGVVYFRIQMIGFVFMGLTSTITAVLRGVGNSRTAMIYNLVSNLVNCALNYVFIYGNFGAPRLEVAGASLATIIGQFVAFVIAMVVVLRGKSYIKLELKKGFKPNKEVLSGLVSIGVPSMIEQLIMRAGMIIYSKTVAGLGTVAFATHQVCMNIQAMSFMNGQAFAVSATSLVGQSLGKKRLDMAGVYSSRTQKLGMAVSMILVVLFVFFGEPLIRLYNEDPQVVSQGTIILLMVAALQPLQSSQFIFAGALRGAGDTKTTATITFITMLLVRPLVAIFCINVLHWGLIGAWVAMIMDQLLRSILVGARYYSGKWKTAYKPAEQRK